MPGMKSAKRLQRELLVAPSWHASERFGYLGEQIDAGGSGPLT